MSDFATASTRIDTCLLGVQTILADGVAGRIDDVYQKLQALHKLYDQSALPKDDARWLTANSDRSVQYQDKVWSSSHEAASAISQTVLYDLLITALDKWYEPRNKKALVDLSKSLAIPDKTVAEVREGIRRERAKLLAENNQPTGINDSDWPKQIDLAKKLGMQPMEIQRLCEDGTLRTNGKKGKAKRIDPASVLAYCDLKDIAYNES